MEADAFHKTLGFLLTKRLMERTFVVRIQVIANDVDHFCFNIIFFNKVFDELREISFCSSVGDRDFSPTAFGLDSAKDISGSASAILVIASSRGMPCHGEHRSCVLDDLFALLINTDNGFPRIVRQGVHIQQMLHPFNKLARELGYAPHFFPAMASGHGRPGVATGRRT